MDRHLPVVTPEKMRTVEEKAYAEGCSEETFMEAAGQKVFAYAKKIAKKHSLHKIYLVLGKGNNAGDALVAGRLFAQEHMPVVAVCLVSKQQGSFLYQKKYEEFIAAGGQAIPFSELSFPLEKSLLIDGIFGTGLAKAPREPFASTIEKLRQDPCLKIAVDIPSGLCAKTGKVLGSCLYADYTVFLGMPKWGFFLEEGPEATGALLYGDFGLPTHFREGFEEHYLLKEGIDTLLPPVFRTRHKYSRGSVVAIAGSKQTPGAALLACEACYRSGAGYVRLLHPEGTEALFACSPYELVKSPYNMQRPQDLLPYFDKAKSCLVGPGLGREEEIGAFLKELLFQVNVPLVLDADALYHFPELSLTSSQVVLTPHLGEMRMLLRKEKKSPITREFLEEVAEFAIKHRVYIVLKGVPTFLFDPEGKLRIADFGCPGMATAGSGDVLTGIIAALLAQGVFMKDALYLGCYLHGRAGCKAESAATAYAMTARDITSFLPAVFTELKKRIYE
jgi:hydroxyethylthiazole kinase-like uncharacterized protein yjeF